MSKWQHETRVDLRRSIAVHGMQSAQPHEAAIQFCFAHNVNPYWKYPVHNIVQPHMSDPSEPQLPLIEHQWERVLKDFASEDA